MKEFERACLSEPDCFFLFRKIAKIQHRFNAFGEIFLVFSKPSRKFRPFFKSSVSSQVCLSTCTLLIVLYKSVAIEICRGSWPLLPHYKIEKEKDWQVRRGWWGAGRGRQSMSRFGWCRCCLRCMCSINWKNLLHHIKV